MNITRLKQLRRHLKGLQPKQFDLSSWFRINGKVLYDTPGVTNDKALEGSCGTSACIAGHALALFEPTAPIPTSVGDRAAYLLDLTYDERKALFEPFEEFSNIDQRRSRVTIPQAVQAINNMIATGDPDWEAIVR